MPLFLSVLATGLLRGGLAGAVGQFVLYALGIGSVVSTLTLLVALLGREVLTRVRGIGRLLEPIGALLLLATGGYIIYYWLSAGVIVG